MKSIFKNRIKAGLLIIFGIMFISAIGFYFIQNSGQLSGGKIALPKLIWLAYAIIFWFFVPFLFVIDIATPSIWKLIYKIFLINMLLRASIELFMMYFLGNWSPYYGIGHDVFTIILLSLLLLMYRTRINRDIFLGYTAAVLLMFSVEIYFVMYMLSIVVEPASKIYFVPSEEKHNEILALTWGVVILLSGYISFFIRRWLSGEFIRAGG